MRQISSGCLWISTVANIYSAGSVTPFEQSDSFFEMLCSLLAAHYTTAQARRTPGPLDQLSARERGTCEGILCGLKPEAIAAELEVTPNTVRTYRKRAYAKLGINSRPALFNLAAGRH